MKKYNLKLKERAKKSSLLAIALFSFIGGFFCPQLKAQFIVDTYTNGTHTADLHVDNTALILTFESDLSFEECSTAIARTPNLQPLSNSSRGPAPNTYRVSLTGTQGIAEYNAVKSHLVNNVPKVTSVQPVYKNYSGGLIPSDIIIIRLATLADSSFLISDAKAHRCTVAGKNEYDPLIWYIRQDKRMDPTPVTSSLFNANTRHYRWAETNFVYYVTLTTNQPTDPLYPQQWALRNTGSNYPAGSAVSSGVAGEDIHAVDAWNITRGCVEVKIAIMDEGMDCNHEDYNVYSSGYNALQTSPIFMQPGPGGCYDGVYNTGVHGTYCAGVINAEWNDTGITGLAPEVSLTSIWTFNQIGTDDITLSNAYNWATNNDIDILSGSFAVFPYTFSYNNINPILVRNSIQNFVQNGRSGLGGLIFHSTGNGDAGLHFACSTGTYIGYPASEEDVIAVTGTTPCQEVKSCTDCVGPNTGLASHGTGTDVAAPYSEIWTTNHMGYTGNYTLFSGTSASTPYAAGTMALILAANPFLTHDQARYILESSCDKIGGYTYNSSVTGQPNGTWSNELGYGRINAHSAVLKAMETEVLELRVNGMLVPNNVFTQPNPNFMLHLSAVFPTSNVTNYILWYYNGEEVATGSNIFKATKYGEYKYVLKTNCGFTQSATIRIQPDCQNMSGNLTQLSGTISPGTYSNLNGYYIPDNTTITISGNVNFRNTLIAAGACSKIYVPAGGNLSMDNVKAIGCDVWKGIEVDGNPNVAHGMGQHGNALIGNSYIENAEIGVYSKNGGMLALSKNEFINNIIHIAMADYNTSFSLASIITFNKFGPVKGDAFVCRERRNVDVETSYTSSAGSLITVRPYVLIKDVYSVNLSNNNFYGHALDHDDRYSIPKNGASYVLQDQAKSLTGVFAFNAKAINLISNQFYVYGDCGIHMKNVTGQGGAMNVISSNEIGRFSGVGYFDKHGSVNGMRIESSQNLDIRYNHFLNGLNFGISVTNSFTQVDITANYFFNNFYGVVVAPMEWPFTTTTLNTTNSTSMDVEIRCNKFEQVNIAMGISGNLIDQGSPMMNAQNKFYNIMDWEVVSNGWNNWYYYSSAYPNQVPRISGSFSTMDNTLVSAFSRGNGTAPNIGCYYTRNSLAEEDTESEEPEVNIYPNPFQGSFTLVAPANNSIEVLSTNGRVLTDQCKIDRITDEQWGIDASRLPPGVYVVRLLNDSSVRSVRIVHMK